MDFYDQTGRASHYIGQNGTFYSWEGVPIGIVRDENLFDNRGRQIGRIYQGYLRDLSGNAVLFSDGASGGPLPPIKKIPPIKSIPRIPPIPAIPSIPRIPAIPTFNWSSSSIEQLLEG